MDLQNYRIVDLTHPISEKMSHWPGDPKTEIRREANLEQHGFNLNRVTIGEHSGTHIGAPRHFTNDGQDISNLPGKNLIVKAIKIEIPGSTADNRDYLVSQNDVLRWEEKFAEIEQHCLVLVQTGWSRFWSDHKRYFGREKNKMHFPGISLDAVKLFVEKRKIVGLGTDTAGIDGGISETLAANRFLAEHGIYHLENLNHLELLNCCDNFIFVGALPIEKGSGSPCRVLALTKG